MSRGDVERTADILDAAQELAAAVAIIGEASNQLSDLPSRRSATIDERPRTLRYVTRSRRCLGGLSGRDFWEGKAMKKAPVGIAIVGAVLFVVGLVMIPIPGPGLPIAAIGLVLLVVWAVLSKRKR